MVENYERMLDKICQKSGIEKEELERRVEAKRAKLSGLISKEGAAQVIAAELGISFDNEKLKINELLSGMRKVNVVGKVVRLFPIRSFKTKKGDEGKVANLILADETSNVKVVLWDTNHISLIENEAVKIGTVIEIANGSMRDNEIHLGSFSEMKPSGELIEAAITDRVVREKPIADFRVSDGVKNRAFVVQSFEPRFFHVCPECSKKVVSGPDGFVCNEHGKITASRRALINLVIDDGTENMRAVVFHENIKPLGIDVDNADLMALQRSDLLGKEFIFTGNVRSNKFFNNTELIIESIEEVNLDVLIAELGKSKVK
jgi:replication factor A1